MCNSQACAEYAPDIYRYLHEAQLNYRLPSDYLRFQSDITANMTGVLLDWLVEVAEEYARSSWRDLRAVVFSHIRVRYHLTNETLHLAKQYIERYLAVQKVVRQRLQLVGVCGMLIAAKFEVGLFPGPSVSLPSPRSRSRSLHLRSADCRSQEVVPPGVEDFVYISDNTFTRAQVIEMESSILNTLKFDITNPTALDFLSRYTRVAGSDAVIVLLAK